MFFRMSVLLLTDTTSRALGLSGVGLVWWWVRRQVVADSSLLVAWDSVDVAKTTSRSKTGDSSFLVLGGTTGQESGTHGSDVRARCWEVWAKGLAAVKAAIGAVVTGWASDTGVTR